jgi:hypothetical protein
MASRICTICGKRKTLSAFHNDSQKRSGKRPDCKECVRKRLRERSKTAEYRRYSREYRNKNKATINALKKRYYWDDPEKHRRQTLASHYKHRERRLEALRLRYQENKDEHNKKVREYQKRNWRKTLGYKYKYKERKRATDPIFVLAERISKRIRAAVVSMGYTKRSRTAEILGCDWEHFKRHIESLFLPGMRWTNSSKWHLDHHVPLVTATDVESLERLNHWSNIKPMWIRDNLSKGGRIPAEALVPMIGRKKRSVRSRKGSNKA